MTEADPTPQDDGITPERWTSRIADATAVEKGWRDKGTEIVGIYRAERQADGASGRGRFNMLFANTSILFPSMYQQPPQADVRRRFQRARRHGGRGGRRAAGRAELGVRGRQHRRGDPARGAGGASAGARHDPRPVGADDQGSARHGPDGHACDGRGRAAGDGAAQDVGDAGVRARLLGGLHRRAGPPVARCRLVRLPALPHEGGSAARVRRRPGCAAAPCGQGVDAGRVRAFARRSPARGPQSAERSRTAHHAVGVLGPRAPHHRLDRAGPDADAAAQGRGRPRPSGLLPVPRAHDVDLDDEQPGPGAGIRDLARSGGRGGAHHRAHRRDHEADARPRHVQRLDRGVGVSSRWRGRRNGRGGRRRYVGRDEHERVDAAARYPRDDGGGTLRRARAGQAVIVRGVGHLGRPARCERSARDAGRTAHQGQLRHAAHRRSPPRPLVFPARPDADCCRDHGLALLGFDADDHVGSRGAARTRGVPAQRKPADVQRRHRDGQHRRDRPGAGAGGGADAGAGGRRLGPDVRPARPGWAGAARGAGRTAEARPEAVQGLARSSRHDQSGDGRRATATAGAAAAGPGRREGQGRTADQGSGIATGHADPGRRASGGHGAAFRGDGDGAPGARGADACACRARRGGAGPSAGVREDRQMTTYVIRDGKLVEKSKALRPDGPFFMRDIETYASPITGEPITSRSHRREEMRRHNVVDPRDLKGELQANGKRHRG